MALRAHWFRSISSRLLLLLLVAESPLAAFTVSSALQNDQLRARLSTTRAASTQLAALNRLEADLRPVADVFTATQAMPRAVLDDPASCARFLANLTSGMARTVSVRITDARGATRCMASTGAASAPSLDHIPVETGSPAQLILSRPLPIGGSVQVRLAGEAVQTQGSRDDMRLSLWLRHTASWLAVNAAPPATIPRNEAALPPPGASPTRLTARDGRTFLYSTLAPPAGAGEPGDALIAGADIGAITHASDVDFATRIAELAGLFIAELLLIAAGVSAVAARPLQRLNDAVDQWRAHGRFSGVPSSYGPAEVGQLFISFTQATDSLNQRERELVQATAQQELLLQEIHHRIKNNLQIIASLLNLQAARITVPEARAEFQSARDRVRALATLHRHLYAHGELHMIDLRAFFAELCSQLFLAMDEIEGDRIALEIVAPDINLSSDQAVPIALIVTETVGNALKYAFPDGRRGRIQVGFALQDATSAVLTVSDDGVGLPDRPDGTSARGLGLQLVRGFARQLGARLTISSEHGTCYTITMAIEQRRAAIASLGQSPQATPSPAPIA